MKTSTVKGKRSDRYLELIRKHPLRPIRNDHELDTAVHMLNFLLDRGRLAADEKDYFDVLTDLIQKYEDEHIVFERQPDSAMLRHLIEAKGVTQAQVAKDCQIAESTISAVMAGTRKLTRGHISKLAHYFHVGTGVFADND